MQSVSITLATEAEAPACLAIVPEAQGTRTEILIARQDGALAGAACVGWASWSKPAGFPVALRVLEPARRRGIGRALVKAAADLARTETDGLWSMHSVAEGSPAAAFMGACGFRPLSREHHFRVGVRALHDSLAPIVGRLRARGRIPEAVRAVNLREAQLDEVAWLVSAQFNSGPFRLLQSLATSREGAGALDFDLSLALLSEAELVGALLVEKGAEGTTVAANVVAPRWRGGWANALMLQATTAHALERGVEAVRFYCDESVRDTMRLAERSGAALTRSTARFYYAIESD